MTTTAETIVANVRRLSSLFNNNLFSDAQIVQLFNDGAGELYDWIVGQYETWFLDHIDFPLPYPAQETGNVFPMPMSVLLKDNTLEMNPTSNNPIPVPRLSSWSDRNSFAGIGYGGTGGAGGCGRRYYPAGSNLMVFPPNSAAGSYRLWYTPKYIPIADTYPIPPAVPTVPATINTISHGVGTSAIGFNGSAWTSESTGDTLVISNSSNGNNGSYVLTVVDSADVTVAATLANESGTGVTAVVQPQGTTNAFNVVMEPWVLYPEIHAAVQIRASRQQDTADLVGKLAALKQRIESATANRTEEVGQTPLRDNPGYPFGNSW